jgi:hypothetical protein
MTGIKLLLTDYKEVAATMVTVAKEVSNISFKTDHGYVTFTGVCHEPGQDRNLVSVSQLARKGF